MYCTIEFVTHRTISLPPNKKFKKINCIFVASLVGRPCHGGRCRFGDLEDLRVPVSSREVAVNDEPGEREAVRVVLLHVRPFIALHNHHLYFAGVGVQWRHPPMTVRLAPLRSGESPEQA
jgi:hypothetical protein